MNALAILAGRAEAGSPEDLPVTGQPLGVIDIGSNSGRLVVVGVDSGGHLRVLADARSPLRLARDVGTAGRLSTDAIDRTVLAVRDFLAVARGAGAKEVVAVATSAVRESANAPELLERIRGETGMDVEVIDGDREAALACAGAVHGLPVDRGLLVDLGGGSLEVSGFRERRPTRQWTLPLGALVLSDRFLASDPPAEEEIAALRDHVAETLGREGVPALGSEDRLVATGGTVRNLARVDERRHRWFIPHLHGYVLARRRVDALASLLAAMRLSKRRSVPGLASDRADSIAGGVLALLALMEAVRADDLLVSGQGLREGVALEALGFGAQAPALVREASVAALASRFTAGRPERAGRRRQLAEELSKALHPGSPPELQEMLGHAASILDAGEAIDHYGRFGHAAGIVMAADLAGFSHRDLAMLAGILREAGDESVGKSFAQLLTREDRSGIRRAGVLLSLADEIERRTPPSEPAEVDCEVQRREAVLTAPVLAAWQPRDLHDRFRRAFGRRLSIRGGAE